MNWYFYFICILNITWYVLLMKLLKQYARKDFAWGWNWNEPMKSKGKGTFGLRERAWHVWMGFWGLNRWFAAAKAIGHINASAAATLLPPLNSLCVYKWGGAPHVRVCEIPLYIRVLLINSTFFLGGLRIKN